MINKYECVLRKANYECEGRSAEGIIGAEDVVGIGRGWVREEKVNLHPTFLRIVLFLVLKNI